MNKITPENLSKSDQVMFPIFIGGTGRSGTTILKRILTCHSKICSLKDELSIIIHPDGVLDLVNALSDRWSPYAADTALHKFKDLMLTAAGANSIFMANFNKAIKVVFRKIGASPPRYIGAGLKYYFKSDYYHQRLEKLLSDISYHTTRGSWAGSPPLRIRSVIYEAGPYKKQEIAWITANFINDLYKHAAHNRETYWLDDTPYNILRAHELLELFPKMHMIHIFRDPRDVLSSYRNFSWGGDNYLTIARRLSGIYQRWFDIRKSIPKEHYLEIGLEALSDDPEAHLRKICDFLDINFEDGLLSIPLDKVHAGRWKQNLAKENREDIEKILEYYIVEYGYAI